MLRLVISFALALCGHLYLLQYTLDLTVDTPPLLISDSSVSVTLHQSPAKKKEINTRESTRERELKTEPQSVPAPPLLLKSHPVEAGKKKRGPARQNIVQKKKKKVHLPPEQVPESTPLVAEDNSPEQPVRESVPKRQIESPGETASRKAAAGFSQETASNQRDSAPHPAISSVIEAKPLYQHNPKPVYPNIARKRGWQGIVSLLVEVTATGEVAAASLHRSSGYTILDKSALRAVRSWRFLPGTRDGKVSQSTVIIPVHFQLQK